LILATPLPTNPFPDLVCWGLLGNSDFSTKMATWADMDWTLFISLYENTIGFGN